MHVNSAHTKMISTFSIYIEITFHSDRIKIMKGQCSHLNIHLHVFVKEPFSHLKYILTVLTFEIHFPQ